MLGAYAAESIEEAIADYQNNPSASTYDLAEGVCQAALAANYKVASALGLDVGGL